MSNNSLTSPHNLQKMQTAATAMQVAQTAKMNRSLEDLKQISVAQAHLAQANVNATRQVAAGVDVMGKLQRVTNSELAKQTVLIAENTDASKQALIVLRDMTKEVIKVHKSIDKGNEIARQNLIESQIANALQRIEIDNSSLRFEVETNEKDLKKLEKKYFSSMMEVIFLASEEIKEISASEKHNIEIFFQLNSLIQSIKDAGIATDKVDDLDTKTSINKLLNETDNAMKDCLINFNQSESEDLADILDILAVDEEKSSRELTQKIKEKNLAILEINRQIKNIEKNVLDAQNQVNKLRPIVIENS